MISGLPSFPCGAQLGHHLDQGDQSDGQLGGDDDADHGEDGDEEEHVGGEKQEDWPDVNPLKVGPGTVSLKNIDIVDRRHLSMKAHSEEGRGSERFWWVRTAQVVTTHNGRPAMHC